MDEANESQLWIEDETTARARIEQARALKPLAAESGLRFEVYLTPDLANWVLGLVEQGIFLDPSEAIFHLMQEAKELAPHSDLKEELLRRRLAEAEQGESISSGELKSRMTELKKRLKARPEPAYWEKIDQPVHPE